jgi:hypothetical protein
VKNKRAVRRTALLFWGILENFQTAIAEVSFEKHECIVYNKGGKSARRGGG